jgi:hypothetical protein
MSENAVARLNAAYREFHLGKFDRRSLMVRANAVALSAATIGMFGRLVPVAVGA